MRLFNPKIIIILAPHTDDGEFGCGGSIASFIDQGIEIYYMAFSVCEQSVPYGLSEDTLERELKAATKVLGIKPESLIIKHYVVRHFPEHRQSILQDMLNAKDKVKPDLVFMPSLNDIHQDHKTIAEEGLRAFKDTTILAYEMPWNNLTFNTSSFIKFEERHLQTKLEALKKYESQYFRHYASEEFLRSLAIVRGAQIGGGLAETFDVVRLIVV